MSPRASFPPRVLLLLALPALAACWRGGTQNVPAPQRLSHEVREILATDEPSAAFYRARNRLERMGGEIDAVLVELINDAGADRTAQANALVLLADRRSPAAVPVLRRVLLASEDDQLRASAIVGLQRLAGDSPHAANAIRSAIGDPSARVRLSVLQALDVEDVALIRQLLRREDDPQVRAVARELVALAESRGASLPAGADGTYRSTAPEGAPAIVFQPSWADSVAGISVGALWAEVPGAKLVPLAQRVEAVAGVIPAFFSPDRSTVVYETEREVRVRNLRNGNTRVLGPGVAPRLVPFTDRLVYLEEQPALRREVPGGTELTYRVLISGFTGGAPQLLGEVRAVTRPGRRANASPVRWMVIGETPEGFVLRGEDMTPFLLPNPFRGPGPTRPAPRRRPR